MFTRFFCTFLFFSIQHYPMNSCSMWTISSLTSRRWTYPSPCQAAAALPSCHPLRRRHPSPPPLSTAISMPHIVIEPPPPPIHCATTTIAVIPIATLADAHCRCCCRRRPLIVPLSIDRTAVYCAAADKNLAAIHLLLSDQTAFQGACGFAAARREGSGHGSGWRAGGGRLIK